MKKILFLSLFLSSQAFAVSTDTFIDYKDYLPTKKQTRTYKITCINSTSNGLDNCAGSYTKVIEIETPSTTQATINRNYYNINNGIVHIENVIYSKTNNNLILQSITTSNSTAVNYKTTYSNNSYLKSSILSTNKQSDYYLTNPISSWSDESIYTRTVGTEKSNSGNIIENRLDYLKSFSVLNVNYNNIIKRSRTYSGGSKTTDWLAPNIGPVKRFIANTSYTVIWELTNIK